MKFCNKYSLKPFLFSASILSTQNIYDRVKKKDTKNVDDEGQDKKWERLKKMYSYGLNGTTSPQLQTITDATFFSLFAGFCFGGINDSKETYIKFIAENQTTSFKHHLEAKRALQDAMTLSIFRGGWRVGWRLSLITTSILTIIISMNTYRGHSSITDFSLAGATTCALYKFKQGPKPVVAGAVVGGVLGTVMGGVVVGFSKLVGVTFDNIYENEAARIEKNYQKNVERTNKLRAKRFKTQNKLENEDDSVIDKKLTEDQHAKDNSQA